MISSISIVNTIQIIISNVCWWLQNTVLDQPAITNSMHSQFKDTLTSPLPKHILYLKQLAEYLHIPGVTQGNLELNPPLHSLDSHQKRKDKILNWYLILNSWNAALLTFHFPGAMLHNVDPKFHAHLEPLAQGCSVKKVFLEVSQNPQENASLCTGVFLWILQNF